MSDFFKKKEVAEKQDAPAPKPALAPAPKPAPAPAPAPKPEVKAEKCTAECKAKVKAYLVKEGNDIAWIEDQLENNLAHQCERLGVC